MITESEYKYLFEYTRRHYSRYYDVQLEVLDHLASMIEDIREQDPSVGFKSALNIAYKSMPGKEFDKVIVEKEKALKKYWNKQIIAFIISYLRLPMIIKTIVLALVIFTTCTFLPLKAGTGIGSFLLVGFGIHCWMAWNSLRLKEDQFLSVRAFLKIGSGMWLVPIYFVHLIELFEMYGLGIQLLISFLLSLFLILIYGLLIHFPRVLKNDILNKYEALIPKIS